ncbi:MAG: ribosome-associated translation inhibitor RaiA [Planctomycetaceae bacterium]|jgi:putative sigma-54 modulation protein|nr:ribosome-associated translation inhibitor RaiA [Planctomycetaceae bacterium]
MQVRISTRHGSISEATETKIKQKVEKLQRVFDRLMSIDVTVDLEKTDEPNIEVQATAEHKGGFVASDRSGDMFGSLDKCIGKLEQQIKKYKEQIQDHNRAGANTVQE